MNYPYDPSDKDALEATLHAASTALALEATAAAKAILDNHLEALEQYRAKGDQ